MTLTRAADVTSCAGKCSSVSHGLKTRSTYPLTKNLPALLRKEKQFLIRSMGNLSRDLWRCSPLEHMSMLRDGKRTSRAVVSSAAYRTITHRPLCLTELKICRHSCTTRTLLTEASEIVSNVDGRRSRQAGHQLWIRNDHSLWQELYFSRIHSLETNEQLSTWNGVCSHPLLFIYWGILMRSSKLLLIKSYYNDLIAGSN